MNSPPEIPPSDPDAKQRGDDGYLSVVRGANLTPTEVFPASKRPMRRSRVEPSLRGHRGLLVVCITGTLVESVLVGLLGPRAALALAPQATAIAPYGVFHDTRWLLVYSHSWLTFGIESAAFLLIRGALTAWTVRLAWPYDADRPRFHVLLTRGVTFTAAISSPADPWYHFRVRGRSLVDVLEQSAGRARCHVRLVLVLPRRARRTF